MCGSNVHREDIAKLVKFVARRDVYCTKKQKKKKRKSQWKKRKQGEKRITGVDVVLIIVDTEAYHVSIKQSSRKKSPDSRRRNSRKNFLISNAFVTPEDHVYFVLRNNPVRTIESSTAPRPRVPTPEGLLKGTFSERCTSQESCNAARGTRTLFYCNINVYTGDNNVIDYKYICKKMRTRENANDQRTTGDAFPPGNIIDFCQKVCSETPTSLRSNAIFPGPRIRNTEYRSCGTITVQFVYARNNNV